MFFRVFVLFFLVLAVGLFMSVQTGSAKDNEHKVHYIPPSKIVAYIKHTTGKRRIIVRYASWCPACRDLMPKLMDIERAQKDAVIAIAIDEDHGDFARYINRYADIPYPVILLRRPKGESLLGALSQFGFTRRDMIPDMALLDENNKVVRQGHFTAGEVARFIFEEEPVIKR